MNELTQATNEDLMASKYRLLGACDYIRIEQERLGDDLAENKRRMGMVDAEIARRIEAARVEEAAEAARLADAKRQHDAEVAAYQASEYETPRFTPEEEGAAVAKVNGQPKEASA